MRKVEAQPLGVDERSFLGHVRPEDLPQCLVQNVGRGVVGPDGGSAVVVDLGRQRHAGTDGAASHVDRVHEDVAELLGGIGDAK